MALITTAVEAETELVVIVKLALVPPAGIDTLAGTLTAPELSDRFTVAVTGVAAARSTVPVAEFPPITLAGLTLMAFSTDDAGELIVSGANRVTLPSTALS